MAVLDWQSLRLHFKRAKWGPFAVVLLVQILFALALLRSPGTRDVSNYFMRWIAGLVKHGLVEGFRVNSDDYPPYASVMLLLVAKTATAWSIDLLLCFKISLVVALLCTTICFWAWTLDATLAGLLTFSVFLNGVALGYVDSYLAPTILLSLWALQRKNVAIFSLFFTVSCLIKWQPLIIGPFLALHAVSLRRDETYPQAKMWARLIGPALAVVLCAVAVFGYQPMAVSLWRALHDRFLSGNALNFNWLVTCFLHAVNPGRYGAVTGGVMDLIRIDPGLGWARIMKVVFILFYLVALWRLIKLRTSFVHAIECSFVGYLAFFTFNIGVHENHLFLATILAAIGAAFVREKIWRAVLVVAVSDLNLIAFYGFSGGGLGFSRVVGFDMTILFAAVNVVAFLWWWGDLVLRPAIISDESSSRTGSAALPLGQRGLRFEADEHEL